MSVICNRRRLLIRKKSAYIDPITGRGIIDGYEVVDLGLPSGLLFATCNIGADSETGYGNYYQWGAGSTQFIGNTIQYYTGSETILPPEYDSATQVMGRNWRTPTIAEWQELVSNTTSSWVTINRVQGRKFISIKNRNAYLFIPAAGCYTVAGKYLDYKYCYDQTANSYDSLKSYYFFAYRGGVTPADHPDSNSKQSGLPVRSVHAAI